MKNYIIAFFTFIGYTTFLFALGAGIVLYIGHRKSQAAEAAVMTTQDGQVVSMSPEKQADTLTTPAQTLPHFQPISRKPVSATKTKPVRHIQRKPDTPVSAPAMYAEPKVTRTITVEKSKPKATKTTVVKSKPKAKKPRPAATIHADLGIPEEPQRGYQVTDRTASPRTGGSRIPDVHAEPSELELQAKRQVQMEQLKQAAKEIREPKGFESGLLKFFGGK